MKGLSAGTTGSDTLSCRIILRLKKRSDTVSISITLNFDLKTGVPRIHDDVFFKNVVAGHESVEKEMKQWNGYRERQQKIDEDLHRRWEEQGEKIRAEVEASGGKIGN
jgi:hypothetical protein